MFTGHSSLTNMYDALDVHISRGGGDDLAVWTSVEETIKLNTVVFGARNTTD